MTNILKFKVTGEEKIHCAGCEERIVKALARVPGIQKVEASPDSQQIQVSIDSATINSEQVRGQIEKLGYQVSAET